MQNEDYSGHRARSTQPGGYAGGDGAFRRAPGSGSEGRPPPHEAHIFRGCRARKLHGRQRSVDDICAGAKRLFNIWPGVHPVVGDRSAGNDDRVARVHLDLRVLAPCYAVQGRAGAHLGRWRELRVLVWHLFRRSTSRPAGTFRYPKSRASSTFCSQAATGEGYFTPVLICQADNLLQAGQQ